MKNILDRLHLKYVEQFPIRLSKGFHTADFAIPEAQIAIECDGDYWHSLPNVKVRDNFVNEELKKAGWAIIRIREAQIKSNKVTDIMDVLGRHKRELEEWP